MIDQRYKMMDKSKFQLAVKWVVGITAILVGGLIAAAVLTSVVTIAITGVVTFAAIQFAPVVAQKITSWKYQALRADAIENPIPNLIKRLSDQNQVFTEKKNAVVSFATTTKNFKSRMEEFAARKADTTGMQATYENMKRVLNMQLGKLELAKDALDESVENVKRAQDDWEMSLEIIKANEKMSIFTDTDPVAAMLERISYHAVSSKLNQAMSELEVSMTLDFRQLPKEIAGAEVVSGNMLIERLEKLEVSK